MEVEKQIKTIIADDYRLIREGLRKYLSQTPDLDIVGEASNGLELVKLAEEYKPDIILMNISLPNLDGFEAAKIIKKMNNAVAILMLTFHYNEQNALRAYQSGINGILPKYSAASEIIKAIKDILNGKLYFEQSIIIASNEESNNSQIISERETEILELIAENHSNKEIANRLFISYHTVETHKKNLIKKLNLNNARELHVYAFENLKNNGIRY